MLYFVYELIDPRTDQTFYIGITNHPNGRMMQHLTVKDTNEVKSTRISEIQSENLLPKMNIIEIVEGKEKAKTRERYYIHAYTQQNILLTNIQYMPLSQATKDRANQARGTSHRKQEILLPINFSLEAVSYIEPLKVHANQVIQGDHLDLGLDPVGLVTNVKQNGDSVWIMYADRKKPVNRIRCHSDYELHIMPRSASI